MDIWSSGLQGCRGATISYEFYVDNRIQVELVIIIGVILMHIWQKYVFELIWEWNHKWKKNSIFNGKGFNQIFMLLGIEYDWMVSINVCGPANDSDIIDTRTTLVKLDLLRLYTLTFYKSHNTVPGTSKWKDGRYSFQHEEEDRRDSF